jgi:hypothetical protein
MTRPNTGILTVDDRSTDKRNKVAPRYGRTPHALLNAKLGLHANAVFQALSYHDGGGIVNPSLATIGKLADLSVNTVRKALQVLVTKGWVEVKELSRKGCMISVEYRLSYESPDQPTVSPGDTVTAPSHGVKKRTTVSNHGVKNGHFTVSPGDNEQELITRRGNKTTPNPLQGALGDMLSRSSPTTISKPMEDSMQGNDEARPPRPPMLHGETYDEWRQRTGYRPPQRETYQDWKDRMKREHENRERSATMIQ